MTVAISTQPGDRHRVGCLGWRFWGVGFGFRAEGCRPVGVQGLHNAPKRVATVRGWLAPLLGAMAPNSGVNGAPGV